MWAGGAIQSLGALVCDEYATRRTRVVQSVDKQGRTGHLTIVSIEHEVSQRGEVKVRERQDLVYREAVALPGAYDPDTASPVPAADYEREIEVTPPLLFRYSALTYNGHRIHYDRDYARDVEGTLGCSPTVLSRRSPWPRPLGRLASRLSLVLSSSTDWSRPCSTFRG